MKFQQAMLALVHLVTILSLGSACQELTIENPESTPVSHAAFNTLLQKHVNAAGGVNYAGIQQEEAKLDAYLAKLNASAPNDSWSKDEQLAYWINLYNAYTIKLILEHYPVNSIKDIGGKIPMVNSPWDYEFIPIGGKKYTLNNIEHNIIRKKWDEPRIHFALVCAAKSCPRLRNEAYVASKLDAQLTAQAKIFLASDKNSISKDRVVISQLFNWYQGDFIKKTSLIGYLNKYSTVKIDSDAEIEYMDYDWALNKQ